MTDKSSRTLKGLQDLDTRLEQTRSRLAEFDPLLEEVEEPALALEKEASEARARLEQMKREERHLERSADDRRGRVKKLQEKLKSVRNLREQAAVEAELDLVRQTLEGEEQEALGLLDQIRKLEARVEELEAEEGAAREAVEPRRQALLEERETTRKALEELEEERKAYAATLEVGELRAYDRIRQGGRSVAIASLTPDGACGHCFSLVPLQVQNEIREGRSMVTCEACGVILTPAPEPEGEEKGGDGEAGEEES